MRSSLKVCNQQASFINFNFFPGGKGSLLITYSHTWVYDCCINLVYIGIEMIILVMSTPLDPWTIELTIYCFTVIS